MPDIGSASLEDLRYNRGYRYVRFDATGQLTASKDKKEWDNVVHEAGHDYRLPCHTVIDLHAIT